MVSWHIHLLAWNESKSAITTRIERLNKKGILLPIADGLAAAHQKRISKGKLADKFCYILKSPRKAYRLYKWETVSPDGEIIPKFKQWKDDLRPGERLTLFRLLQDMKLSITSPLQVAREQKSSPVETPGAAGSSQLATTGPQRLATSP